MVRSHSFDRLFVAFDVAWEIIGPWLIFMYFYLRYIPRRKRTSHLIRGVQSTRITTPSDIQNYSELMGRQMVQGNSSFLTPVRHHSANSMSFQTAKSDSLAGSVPSVPQTTAAGNMDSVTLNKKVFETFHFGKDIFLTRFRNSNWNDQFHFCNLHFLPAQKESCIRLVNFRFLDEIFLF